MSRGQIVIAGSLAQRPGVGGHAWVFLQYLLGFKRLGWNVLFLDRLDAATCHDSLGRPCGLQDSQNWRGFIEIMRGFDLEDSFSLDFERGQHVAGVSRDAVLESVRRSAMLINVMGYLDDEEILTAAPRRAFLDIDPGFGQMWQDLGLASMFQGHDFYFTVGLNLARPECKIPCCGIPWIATPPPVVLEQWPAQLDAANGRFTSVVSWRGLFGPVEYRGETYGLRVHEFRRFIELPTRAGLAFELALDIDPSDGADRERLVQNAWTLVDPHQVAADPWSYRSYIQGSLAEFMIAKQMYVKSCSGWLSDRSVCYLASGRPVLAQDTGLRWLFPNGEGLLLFSTVEEAQDGAARIATDYKRQSKAARALAHDCFDSDKVLTAMLSAVGVG